MFTDEDFLRYTSELDIVERNMHDLYVSALNEIEDEKIREIFEKLIIEESEHINLVSRLRQIAISKLS